MKLLNKHFVGHSKLAAIYNHFAAVLGYIPWPYPTSKEALLVC